MTSIQPRASFFLAALAAALCASPAAAQDGARASTLPSSTPTTTAPVHGGSTAERAVRSTRTRLEADVIRPAALVYGDAYTLIAALRPGRLAPRSPDADVRVYFDGRLAGGADELRTLDLASVRRIEWRSGIDATPLGLRYSGAAIHVTTR